MRIHFMTRSNPLAAAIACMVATPLVLETGVVQAQDLDLGNLGARGFRLDGIVARDLLGSAVAGAGDFNGDGLSDLVVGAPGADPDGKTNAGTVYVVFGRKDGAPVDLANLGSRGFRINGIDAGDELGESVSGAGDVNGDGLADLIVGARDAAPGGRLKAGESYVVFGKSDPTTVELSTLGTGGFRIDGVDPNDYSGDVSGAGDVNGDGLADLLVGAGLADPGGDLNAGEVYVVFGKSDFATVELANLGSGGFRIDGINPGDLLGFDISGAGDVNGDGLSDLVVGSFRSDVNGVVDAGQAHVVFGKADGASVDLSNLGSGGFRINGTDTQDRLGGVGGAGDVNGDGLADVIVSAEASDPGGRMNAGEVFVIFGKPDNAEVATGNLGTGGFAIAGAIAGDYAGGGVAGAGDVNGDGYSDLIVGAGSAEPDGISRAGRVYVIYGKPSPLAIDLAALGSAGFRMDGENALDLTGGNRNVSGAGDLNGDGLADVLAGARSADPGGRTSAGTAYAVFSGSAPLSSAVYRARSRNGNPPRTVVGISGDGNNDSTPDARFWIDFADGAASAAASSLETVTLARSSGALPAPGASVSWRFETSRQNWTSAEVRLRYLDEELVDAENTLVVVFSPNGLEPFTPLESVVNPIDNSITANITQPGFLYLGRRTLPDFMFGDDFEGVPGR